MSGHNLDTQTCAASPRRLRVLSSVFVYAWRCSSPDLLHDIVPLSRVLPQFEAMTDHDDVIGQLIAPCKTKDFFSTIYDKKAVRFAASKVRKTAVMTAAPLLPTEGRTTS